MDFSFAEFCSCLGKKLSLTFGAQLGAYLREAVLGAVSLSGGFAERPDAAADLLQRHFGGPRLGSAQCWQAMLGQESGGCCVGAWGGNEHFCRKIDCPAPARLHFPLCMSWGKEKH